MGLGEMVRRLVTFLVVSKLGKLKLLEINPIEAIGGLLNVLNKALVR